MERSDERDPMRAMQPGLFGGGILVSDAAAERAAAERAVIVWPLSEREWEIIRRLNGQTEEDGKEAVR